MAGTGDRPGREGVSPTAGAVGATFTADVETVVSEDSGRRQDAAPAVGGACFPIRSDGCVIGVLEVRFAGPLRSGDLDRVRRAAADLGDEIAALGGPPAESAAQRMLRHMTSLSALEDPAAIASAVLAAAIDLMGLESAALVRPVADAGGDADAPDRVAPRSPRRPPRPDRVAPRSPRRPPRPDRSAPRSPRRAAAIGPVGAALAATPAAAIGPLGAALAATPAAAIGPLGAALAATPAATIGPLGAALAATPAAAIGPLGAALAAIPAATIGPLGNLLGATPAAALASLTHPAGDAAEALVVHPGADPTHAAVARLRANGARTLVTVSLVASGQPRGVLLLAGRASGRAVAIERRRAPRAARRPRRDAACAPPTSCARCASAPRPTR